MVRIFIGYDKRESVAYHVCAHSILKRSSVPVSITPLNRDNLGFFTRTRGPYDSTDFAISRFLVPYLCDYEGFGVFLDGDMVVLDDIVHLTDHMNWNNQVSVVKHNYTPKEKTKFLGQQQTVYERKNWSSVMVFNNARCRNLTHGYVETAPGLDLHQFKWADDVGELPKEWNWLVGEPGYEKGENVKLLHYTKGTPCFPEYSDCDFAEIWKREYLEMTSCG